MGLFSLCTSILALSADDAHFIWIGENQSFPSMAGQQSTCDSCFPVVVVLLFLLLLLLVVVSMTLSRTQTAFVVHFMAVIRNENSGRIHVGWPDGILPLQNRFHTYRTQPDFTVPT
jgi:hypothetical protein